MRASAISNFGAVSVVAPTLILSANLAVAQTTQIVVQSNAQLQTLTPSLSSTLTVTREGFLTPGDGGYAQYYLSSKSATCDVQDSGYQVQATNLGTKTACFYALIPPKGLPLAVWGLRPNIVSSQNGFYFKNAISASSRYGIPLWCGAGLYTLPVPTTVDGPGVSLTAAPGTCVFQTTPINTGGDGAGDILNITASHVHVNGITFDGRLSTVPSDGVTSQLATTLVNVKAGASPVTDVVFDEDRFQNSVAAGIKFIGTPSPLTNSGVRNSTFHNVGMWWHVAGPASVSANGTLPTLTATSTLSLTGVVPGMAVYDATNPSEFSTGATLSNVNTVTSGGTTTLTFVVSPGGTATVAGDTIAFGPPFYLPVSSGVTSSTLTFTTLPAGLVVGMSVSDATNPVALPVMTAVIGTTSTSVTLSHGGTFASGDSILFGPPYFLSAAGTTGTVLSFSQSPTELAAGMSVYDETSPTAIPGGTTITAVSGLGTTVGISHSATISSSDTLVFGYYLSQVLSGGTNTIGLANVAIEFDNGLTSQNTGNFSNGNRFDLIGSEATDINSQSNFTFEDNICDLTQSGWQAAAPSTYGVACVWALHGSQGVSIANNLVDGATSQCVPVGDKVRVSGLTTFGNVIRNCGGSAIPAGGILGGHLEGNMIADNYQSKSYLLLNTINQGGISFLCGNPGTNCVYNTNNLSIGPNTITDDQGAVATMPSCLWLQSGSLVAITLTGLTIDSDISCSNATSLSFGGGFAVSGGSLGTVSNSANPSAFALTLGSGSTPGTIGLPPAPSNWNCQGTDVTTQSSSVFITKQTSSGTAGVSFSNYTTNGTAANWLTNDVLAVTCSPF